jgi:hypothetical protein
MIHPGCSTRARSWTPDGWDGEPLDVPGVDPIPGDADGALLSMTDREGDAVALLHVLHGDGRKHRGELTVHGARVSLPEL